MRLVVLALSCSVALPAVARAQAPDAGVPLGAAVADNESALGAFREALEHASRGAGRVGVVVLGDSHTAADVWTETLHDALAQPLGDAGPGLVFPLRPFPAYRHEDLEVRGGGAWTTHRVTARDRTTDAYGLAGLFVESLDPLAFGELRTPDGSPAESAELWLWSQVGGGHLLVTVDADPPIRVDLGTQEDETPHAVYVPIALAAGAHVLRIAPESDGPVRVLGCVVEHADARGVTVDTLGINGARARDQLSWDDALFREQLARRAPALVVLAYGTNESGDDDAPLERYEQDLRRVVTRVREAVPSASVLLVAPTDRMRRTRRHGPWEVTTRETALVEIQRRVARELGCASFDTVAWMGGEGSVARWLGAELATGDHVHLTCEGYRLLGGAVGCALVGAGFQATTPE